MTDQPTTPAVPDPTRPLVSVSGLAKAFGEHEVLRSVDFEVPAGCFTVVIGPSGSG